MGPQNHSITAVLLLLALTLATAEENSQSSQSTSFHDVLTSNGLPIGLFPKGISDFSIDPASGRFDLHMLSPSPCDANFETRLRYERDISGSLSYGKIANLSGVSAEELFLWLPVKGIQVDVPSSGLIYFDVGVVSKQYSLSLFETPKDCNAMEPEDVAGKNDVVLVDDDARIVENQSRNFVRKRVMDQQHRAVFVNARRRFNMN